MKTELFNHDKNYGDDYKNHLLEQYKLYLQGIENISDRRQSANNFFITTNAAILSLLGISLSVNLFNDLLWLKFIVSIVGIILCVIFRYLINSYKQLNTGKFKVLHEIEAKLPLQIYKYEWSEALGQGNDPKIYYPFSHIEILIPWIFGFVYFFLGLLFIFCG